MATEAYLLLSLPGAILTTSTGTQQGDLGVECVTMMPSQDVFLVLRVGSHELPLDPTRTIIRNMSDSSRLIYQLKATQRDPTDVLLSIDNPPADRTDVLEDIESFEGVMSQYADFRVLDVPSSSSRDPPPPYVNERGGYLDDKTIQDKKPSADKEDLRGHLLLVDHDNGEIVGELDERIKVNEDPILHQKGHENDPVLIEVAEAPEGDPTPLQAFAQSIPEDQHDWMTKSATAVSHVISQSTHLLITVVTGASNYYIKNSKPVEPKPDGTQSRVAVFLSSDRARKGMKSVHTFSGRATKVSGKTIEIIDDIIKSAVGNNKGKGKETKGQIPYRNTLTPTSYTPRVRSRSPSPNPALGTSAPAKPTLAVPSNHVLGEDIVASPVANVWANLEKPDKPPLPPRNGDSRSPSPIPPGSFASPIPPAGQGMYGDPGKAIPPPPPARPPPPPARPPAPPASAAKPSVNATSGPSTPMPPLPPRKISRTGRLVLSADLILSTLDQSAKQLLAAGSENISNVVGHRYGKEAGENAHILTGTARNVGIVYVDMAGIGRKALIKKVGKEYVKGKINRGK